MNITFNEDQMRSIVTKAIIEGMGEEQKTTLISKAIESLMQPANSEHWNRDKRSKLEVAFDEAARGAMIQEARDALAEPENRAKLRALIASAAEKLFATDNAETVANRLAIALGDALANEK